MIKYYLIFLLFFNNVFASVKDQNRPFGHNISRTDYFPEKGCNVGLQIVACGKNNYALATSPFLFDIYNMSNLFLVKQLNHKINGNKSTMQIAFFDTFNEDNRLSPSGNYRLNTKYQQTSFMGHYIFSKNIRSNYRIHFNLSMAYYFDGKYPFSIRRPTIKKRDYQVNLTTLHEVEMTEYMGIQGEIGVLHIEDDYPRLHTGASIYFRTNRWLFQFGFSLTSTFDGLFVEPNKPNRTDYQQELRIDPNGYNGDLDKERIKEDFSMHPEVTIQYRF